MFIVRDNRKVSTIIAEDGETLTELKLARRGSEFKGALNVLCYRGVAKRLRNLEYVSVYNCGLRSLNGIGYLASTPLRRLNLGNNALGEAAVDGDPLRELKSLPALQELWLEGNGLRACSNAFQFLTALRVLRLSNNALGSLALPDEGEHVDGGAPGEWIATLSALEELAVDSNGLAALPASICSLKALRSLVARNNALSALPSPLPATLVHLNVSSNKLTALGSELQTLRSLTELYANSNAITSIAKEVAALASGALKTLNLANNSLACDAVPKPLLAAWRKASGGEVGEEAKSTAEEEEEDVVECDVTLMGNPVAAPAIAEATEATEATEVAAEGATEEVAAGAEAEGAKRARETGGDGAAAAAAAGGKRQRSVE